MRSQDLNYAHQGSSSSVSRPSWMLPWKQGKTITPVEQLKTHRDVEHGTSCQINKGKSKDLIELP